MAPRLPSRLHKVRHYGLLSRCSTIDLDDVREKILRAREEFDPDLQLEDWTPPILVRSTDQGLRCPVCSQPLQFECFTRIRPPPLEWRTVISDAATTRRKNSGDRVR